MTTTNRGANVDPTSDPTAARDLTHRLSELLRRERHAMADFLLTLADFDRERRWIALGHASLFSFLRRELGLSAGAAQYRKAAAELLQRHPSIEAALRDGKLCLSSVVELAKVVTEQNAASVVPRFYGLSSRDAAAVVAALRPVEDAPTREVVRFATAARPADAGTRALVFDGPAPIPAGRIGAHESPTGSPAAERTRAAAAVSPARERPGVEPLDAKRARLHVTVSRRLAAPVLTANIPAAVTSRALRATIPAAVRRAVWARSGGACEWPLESGGVCGSTLRLELDHVQPLALGGGCSVEDLRVACRRHNQHAARQKLGPWVDRYRRPRPNPSQAAAAPRPSQAAAPLPLQFPALAAAPNPSRDGAARVR